MENLSTILIIFGLLLFLITSAFFKNKIQSTTGFIIALPILGLCMFIYVQWSQYLLNRYERQALNANHQIHYCGQFSQWAEVQHQTRHGTWTEKAFVFYL